MAGSTSITETPTSPGAWYPVRLGGYIPVSVGADTVDTYIVPWNSYVKALDISYVKTGANHVTKVAVTTLDDSKNIRVAADMSANIDGVRQALHADVALNAYEIERGDKLVLSVDTAADEAGILFCTVWLQPVYK